MPQQKVVLKLDVVQDKNSKKNIMKLVSSIPGIESISMNAKDKKLTVIGDMDPISVATKLRKQYHTDIVSVGPVKEPQKPKNEPKKAKDSKKAKEPKPSAIQVNENPNMCVIC